MEIKLFNGKIDWKSLVGKWIYLEDREVVATVYDEEDCSLFVGEFFPGNIGQTTKVGLIDEGKALQILKILGYELDIVEIFSFSNETITKAQGLIQAGFLKLIREGDDYTVDGMFQQNFLMQEELEYLLSLPETEILLSEIK